MRIHTRARGKATGARKQCWNNARKISVAKHRWNAPPVSPILIRCNADSEKSAAADNMVGAGHDAPRRKNRAHMLDRRRDTWQTIHSRDAPPFLQYFPAHLHFPHAKGGLRARS